MTTNENNDYEIYKIKLDVAAIFQGCNTVCNEIESLRLSRDAAVQRSIDLASMIERLTNIIQEQQDLLKAHHTSIRDLYYKVG